MTAHNNEISSEGAQRAAGVPSPTRRLGYLVIVVLNLVALYVFTNLHNWRVPFITAEWPKVLWAVRLSVGANIVGHIILMFYSAPAFKAVLQTILDGFGLLSVYVVLTVFPFEMGRALWEQLWRALLIVSLLATGIGMVVRLARLAMGRYRG